VNSLLVDDLDVIDLSDLLSGGAVDVVFVAVRTAAGAGWYGPVTRQVGQRVRDLSGLVTSTETNLVGTLRRHLKASRGTACDLLTSWALGAVDCALWDLRGKLAGCPVASLLTPAAITSPVRVYASHLTLDLTGLTDPEPVAATAAAGWAFTKWGLRDRTHADADVTAARMARAVTEAAAAAGAPVAVDALRTWSPVLAGAFARHLDREALVWLEDPLPGHDAGYWHLASARLPLVVGELLVLGEELAPLLSGTAPVGLCLDVAGCGGLTRAAAVTRQAARLGIPVYPHGRSLVPGVHLAAAFGRAVPAVEYRLQWEPARQQLLDEPLIPQHGLLDIPQAAGLGTTPRSKLCPTR
jgi:L-alanine-DL-glutamate epimerase-like enolase superfamily enzyme